MQYQLVYTDRAERDIKKLDTVTKKRLGKKLLLFKENPLAYATKLSDSDPGTYRFRVGDHRVIFDIKKSAIIVLRVGHRREIYK